MIKTLKDNLRITQPVYNYKRRGKPAPEISDSIKHYSAISPDEIKKALAENKIITDKGFKDIYRHGCNIVTADFLCRSPFSGYNYYMAKNYITWLIQGLQFLSRALGVHRTEVIVPAEQSEIVSAYSGQIKKLPNIYLRSVKDRYPLYDEKILRKKLYNYKYNTLEEKSLCNGGIFIIDPFGLLRIFYSVISPNRLDYIDTVVVLKNKGYVTNFSRQESVSLLLEKLNISAEGIIIRNSRLNGRAVARLQSEKIGDTRVFFVVKDSEISLGKCIGCGNCVRVCPAGLDRTFSRYILSGKNSKGLVNFKEIPGCDGCGLCGYFCPGFKS